MPDNVNRASQLPTFCVLQPKRDVGKCPKYVNSEYVFVKVNYKVIQLLTFVVLLVAGIFSF